MYGITLILTLAIVGGAIAYIGDRLGMNVGRKKLTLFGLRPKHTSILVTIVTGVLIASASIGVLSIASQDVRTALFRMKEIQGELKGLQADYAEIKGQRDLAQRELLEAETEVEHQRQAIKLNELEIARMSTEVDSLLKQASELQEITEELRTDYAVLSTAWGQIRNVNIAFNASEVILTTVFQKGMDRTQIRAALEEFIQEVDGVAYRRGGRAQEQGPYRAIFIQPGILDFAAEDILLAQGDVIVRAVSESNTIPGVPVLVYLENYLDQMIFSRGTVLASASWDPQGSVDIDQVILEILSEANAVAIDAGVTISRERGAAVLLPGGYFLDAIYASRSINKPVSIRLVVAEDTWRSTAPIEVSLEIGS